MKLCFRLALAILLTGCVYGTLADGTSNDEPTSLPTTEDNVNTTNEDDDNYVIDKLLTEIQHFTARGRNIDLSLNKESSNETCYVVPPGGKMINADLLDIKGVTVQKESDFVSCRITIGPMDVPLLGNWKLCGKSDRLRCQPVNIQYNTQNGNLNWGSITRPFSHPVNFGGSVHSGVSGHSGEVASSCHVITPAGEDLVFTNDVTYPHMELTPGNTALCSILFKNITAEMLGEWIVYGMFRSTLGQNEVRVRLTFALYDENNPYAQAYNVTTLTESQHLVKEGAKSFKIEVSRKKATLDECIFRTPSGQTFNQKTGFNSHSLEGVTFNHMASQNECAIDFTPVTKDAVGKWQIIGKFSNGNLFDELRKSFNVILEDPANPIEDTVNRTVNTQPAQIIMTKMNTTHKIVINTGTFIENESCHLITPDGLQYAFIDGFNVSGVEIVKEDLVECGVIVNVTKEDMIGNWTLVARSTMLSTKMEKRQPFTIRVEENFVIQDDITIREGADVYLHLNYSIATFETCKLYGPGGKEHTSEVEADPLYPNTCGYIIRKVNNTHNGEWIIQYGQRALRKGSVKINVLATQAIKIDNITWTVGQSVDTPLGPNDTVYCRVEDSNGHIIYDNFGRCKIVLDKATVAHTGTWNMSIGLPGAVQLQNIKFNVEVLQRGNKPLVTTTVVSNKPSVLLTCSVPSQHEVQACKFRDPQDNILVAAHGVGQDGYTFNSSYVNYVSNASSHDCTLRLTNPSVQDLGIWRCAMDTSTGTYYGFMTVFAMEDSDVADSVVTEPVLEAESKEVTYMEDEPVVMRCFIPNNLRYCYFRSRNGTVYNVFPGMTSSGNFGYVGSGLDAGECGIRFNSLSTRQSGNWTCHVGLANTTAEEQQAQISLLVRPQMEVRLTLQGSSAVVQARVYHPYTIDYCRFVRMNGLGFTMDNVPDNYSVSTSSNSDCALHIPRPTLIDLHPWTVVIKVAGQDGEISRTTGNLLTMPIKYNIIGEILFWLLIFIICLVPLMAMSALIPKKNRKWTYRRASRLSSSFRNSWNNTFHKKPAQNQERA